MVPNKRQGDCCRFDQDQRAQGVKRIGTHTRTIFQSVLLSYQPSEESKHDQKTVPHPCTVNAGASITCRHSYCHVGIHALLKQTHTCAFMVGGPPAHGTAILRHVMCAIYKMAHMGTGTLYYIVLYHDESHRMQTMHAHN